MSYYFTTLRTFTFKAIFALHETFRVIFIHCQFLEKCLFVPALKDSILQVNGQIYDSEVCHCVYPASRTFLNSFYTLGTQYSLKIAILFCSTIVFSPLADIRLKRALLMKGPFYTSGYERQFAKKKQPNCGLNYSSKSHF